MAASGRDASNVSIGRFRRGSGGGMWTRERQWKSPQGMNTPFNGSFPSSSRIRSSMFGEESGLKMATPAPTTDDYSTNRANWLPNSTGFTLTSTPVSACRQVNSPLTGAGSDSTLIQPRRIAPRARAPQDLAAQRRDLERRFGIEQIQDRPAVRVVDFNHDLGARVCLDVAERQLHGPSAPVHVVGEVEDRLCRLLSLALDRILVRGLSVLQPLGRSLHRIRGRQQQQNEQWNP